MCPSESTTAGFAMIDQRLPRERHSLCRFVLNLLHGRERANQTVDAKFIGVFHRGIAQVAGESWRTFATDARGRSDPDTRGGEVSRGHGG